ncbi:Zn-ribbon domain-containing OB-fold protein [Salirhabdus salicampi]|uniref:Zn-ribbon domain-containing OB-fold protein n=1 Tax=Salirhabdus salicampi TaxID=476102 RepID=UPI0020C528BD|nr:zinc ribbon domain-containing protein [Salirhabdus salicampi]MCP8615250.1 zinc ribbon domain-containing protein [Salirhabdus salicampi]
MREVDREDVGNLMEHANQFSKPFWDGLKNKQIKLQKCNDCTHAQFPPGPVCSKCLSNNISWISSTGKARVWSKIGFWKPYLKPYTDVPYYVVMVKLAEGPMITARISEEHHSKINCDSEVEATFFDTVDGTVLLGFRPAEA